ncbi:MAG TPA: RidA family protein [Chloroflexia bacterium]|nr:RidA family protein [Chloroflexia bacterium]
MVEASATESGRVIVNPGELGRPVGFSHGVLVPAGRLLFLAGQTGTDAAGRLVAPDDLPGQFTQVLRNLQAVVTAAGGAMPDIVQTTIFVQDRDLYRTHLKELGRIHKSFFGSYYPATALVEVARFFEDGVLIEIQGMAVIRAEA